MTESNTFEIREAGAEPDERPEPPPTDENVAEILDFPEGAYGREPDPVDRLAQEPESSESTVVQDEILYDTPSDQEPANLEADAAIDTLAEPPPAIDPDKVVGLFLRSGWTPDQIEFALSGESWPEVEKAALDAHAAGSDPYEPVKQFATQFPKAYEYENLKAEVRELREQGGVTAEQQMRREAWEEADRESQQWLQAQQSEFTAAVMEAQVKLEDAGAKPLDERRLLVKMNELGLIGTVPPAQGVRMALAVMAVGGDPFKAFAPKPATRADGGTVEGTGPRARYVVPVAPTARPIRTIDDMAADIE
jgi:hypothetical protein